MKIIILLGSARKVRNTPIIGSVIQLVANAQYPELDFEIVDLKEWKLPFDAEEFIPKTGKYTSSEIASWSSKVRSADGFVVVAPQYNWGYPAVLKNAFDVLYNEFSSKPVLIATFGHHGGDKCNAQLREVLEGGFGMKVTNSGLQIKIDKPAIMAHELDEEKVISGYKEDIANALQELCNLLQSVNL